MKIWFAEVVILVQLTYFVNESASILLVLIYFNLIKFFSILFLLKWYLIEMCFGFNSPCSIEILLTLLSVNNVSGLLNLNNSYKIF